IAQVVWVDDIEGREGVGAAPRHRLTSDAQLRASQVDGGVRLAQPHPERVGGREEQVEHVGGYATLRAGLGGRVVTGASFHQEHGVGEEAGADLSSAFEFGANLGDREVTLNVDTEAGAQLAAEVERDLGRRRGGQRGESEDEADSYERRAG